MQSDYRGDYCGSPKGDGDAPLAAWGQATL
jgi:hypothetical protein